ncbi:MAG TPA: V-type ATP synthase subunit E [Rhabdochlamydiaceae bacterium]
MKGLETGKDKVKKICEVLKQETLDPARREADEIIAAARLKAEELVEDAHRNIEKMHRKVKEEIEMERTVFQASLSQACRQTIEILKQTIEDKLFNHELTKQLGQRLRQPDVLGALITAVVNAVEKEGIDTEISAFIPAAVPASAVNAFLTDAILHRLKEKSVLLMPIAGGVEVKLHKEHVTIDISEATLKELVAQYIRKDFRELFFHG